MRDAQERVMRFVKAMGAMGARSDVGDPQNMGIHDRAAAVLKARMLLEECTETMIGLVGGDETERLMVRRMRDIDISAQPNTEEVADGCADIQVIVFGIAGAAGFHLAPVFDEVMSANERKIGPGASVRHDGKLLKPIDWVGPDIAGVLARQKAAT